MSDEATRRGLCSIAVICVLLVFSVPVIAQIDDSQTADSTQTTPADSTAQPPEDVREILQWLTDRDQTDSAMVADSAATHLTPIMAPAFAPLPFAGGVRSTFTTLAGLPHTAFSDHLLFDGEYTAPAVTEFGTSRPFTYHGLYPLGVEVLFDGVPLNLRRLSFPQTMAPDLMVVPPYLFASMILNGPAMALRTADTLMPQPYSDFFVRRGDYGMSVTQGRLYRPLPDRRTVNFGFAFAQNDGRSLFDSGDNRYLYGKFITPVVAEYNVAASFNQFKSKADIQTDIDLWRYNFRRDDLDWYLDALLWKGDTVVSTLTLRFTLSAGKQQVTSTPSIYLTEMKHSHAQLSATYSPAVNDSLGGVRAGASFAVDQQHTGSEHFRRPEYRLWGEVSRKLIPQLRGYLSLELDGTDDDSPAPGFLARFSYMPSTAFDFILTAGRNRIVPDQFDREWPLHQITLEDVNDSVIVYSEEGNKDLAVWWSNTAKLEAVYRGNNGFGLGISGWVSAEENYFLWKDRADPKLTLKYRPKNENTFSTVGTTMDIHFPVIAGFHARLQYCLTDSLTGITMAYPEYRPEETTEERLTYLIDRSLTGRLEKSLQIKKYNLVLNGVVESFWWRAPTTEYNDYGTREIFRTDVLGSATIKDFTFYWLAQNLFNYGYRQTPDHYFVGRTIMWGLHLRFFN